MTSILFCSLVGIGHGILYMACLVRLQSYFFKHRALANGVFSCGAGAGVVIYGFGMDASITQFGWRNTMRIFVSQHYSKNPCPCGNRTFPIDVHYQGLESMMPQAVCFPGPDDAPS